MTTEWSYKSKEPHEQRYKRKKRYKEYDKRGKHKPD